MPNVELMISLFGRPYIDVRNSFNSFLPKNLNDEISEKLVNAYLIKLENEPYLHDKIEFDVVFTVLDFTFSDEFNNRYPELLNNKEFEEFELALKDLTIEAIAGNSLTDALSSINYLSEVIQKNKVVYANSSFSIADRISTLIYECSEFGTLPFSILPKILFVCADFAIAHDIN